MRVVPGARGDTSGDRQCPDPVWKSTASPPLPSPLLLSVSPLIMAATMAPRQKLPRRSQPALPPPLAAVNLRAAGIDVGAEAHDVAVPPSDDPPPVRRFGAYTVDLEAVADGLAAGGSTTVVLDSTGVYGSPLFEL
jgi:hypothetical protein